MDRNEFAYLMMDAIHSVLKERHGEITRVLKKLGHQESYLRKYRQRDNCEAVKLGKAGALLEAGEIPPSMFWPRAFPEGCDPLARFRSEAAVLERGARVPKVLLAIREHHAAGELVDAPHDARAADIDEIWQERIADPARAGRRAASMARYGAERPFVARALGVWGAVLRTRGDLNTATIVLGDAIELAEGYPRILAELAQRAAYVVSDRGRFREAADLVEHSIVQYTRCADTVGLGRALVDNGSFLDRCEEYAEAIDAYTAALEFLPESEQFNRCAAHHGLALVYVNLDRLPDADLSLRRALQVQVPLPEIETARLSWLRARVAQARGESGKAVLFFESTLAHLGEYPADYAVAATELVLLKLKTGRIAEATLEAKRLTTVALRIENEIVESMIANLILAARGGELSVDLAKRLLESMEGREAGVEIPKIRARIKN